MLTAADFEPIVSAVPSFHPKWKELIETFDGRTEVGVEFSFEMTEHLVSRAAVGDYRDFVLLFAALEVPLSDPTTEIHDSLTMGFLEDLIHSCERKHINLERIADCIIGPRLRDEWNWAFNYTHAGKKPYLDDPIKG